MDEAAQWGEKRRFARAAASLQIRSRLLDPSELPQLASGLGQAEPSIPQMHLVNSGTRIAQLASVNISGGGLSAEGDLNLLGGKPFSKGTDLVVEFDLPDGKPPVRAVAQVMWTRLEGERPQTGLMFLLIGESELQRIQAFVSKQIESA